VLHNLSSAASSSRTRVFLTHSWAHGRARDSSLLIRRYSLLKNFAFSGINGENATGAATPATNRSFHVLFPSQCNLPSRFKAILLRA
jgi:hypothetical protein